MCCVSRSAAAFLSTSRNYETIKLSIFWLTYGDEIYHKIAGRTHWWYSNSGYTDQISYIITKVQNGLRILYKSRSYTNDLKDIINKFFLLITKVGVSRTICSLVWENCLKSRAEQPQKLSQTSKIEQLVCITKADYSMRSCDILWKSQIVQCYMIRGNGNEYSCMIQPQMLYVRHGSWSCSNLKLTRLKRLISSHVRDLKTF